MGFEIRFRAPVYADEDIDLRWTVTGVDWKESLAGWITRLEGDARSADRLLLSGSGTLLVRAHAASGSAMILDDDHRAVQDAVRAYVQDRIAPRAAEWDRDSHFPRDELQGLAALGCYGVAVPTEHDGAGLDYLALAVILEEIAAGDGATSTIVSVNNCPVVLDPDGVGERGAEGAVARSRSRAARCSAPSA